MKYLLAGSISEECLAPDSHTLRLPGRPGCCLPYATLAGVWLKPRWLLTTLVPSAPWAWRELFSPFLLRRVIEVCYGDGGNPGTGTRVRVRVCVSKTQLRAPAPLHLG